MRVPVSVAVEGTLDEAVARQLLQAVGVATGRVFGKRGRPYLLQNLSGYNAAAQHAPWFVMADLDRSHPCAPTAIGAWLPASSRHMYLRICVQEVESWLLADCPRIASFLGVAQNAVPKDPDALPDPKQVLVNLARRSRKRSVREGLVPTDGSGRSEGRTYTSDLSVFVRESWDISEAALRSPSLSRALLRLTRLGSVR